MATIAALLERNKAVNHPSLPYISELKASGSPPINTLIVTCCDPRCIPENYLNLNPGEVIVHRNAGGNIRHALRDILALDIMFHLEEIAIIHHTDCGTLLWKEDSLHGALKARLDKSLWTEVDNMEFGANTDIVESVRGDLEWARDNALIRDELKRAVQGFVFDVKTGKLEKVNAA